MGRCRVDSHPLNPAAQTVRETYRAFHAKWVRLGESLRIPVLRHLTALRRYGPRPDAIALPVGLALADVRRWLTRLSIDQAAELLGIGPGTWRGYVTCGQAPAADSHTGRGPWWFHASVLLHQLTRQGRPATTAREGIAL
ncbi:hypothetical protein ACIQGT_36445 [Streptomyces sp. NPDC093108]|uniref:hypothetical protein n=1 Tax=Streptomyces sp. NPDC093108 TaxID=3366030 RepID=UPI00380F5E68